MASAVVEKEEIKLKLIEFIEQNNIKCNLLECCGCEKFCISLCNEDNTCEKHCCNSAIIVQMCSKDICKVYPHEILYIAIENRKSVLYLTHGRLETNHRLEHWKDILNIKTFAQPHHSFIVNLNYVDEITNGFVKVRHGSEVYSVYTSSRKIGAFKKAFLNFSNNKTTQKEHHFSQL